MSGEPIRLEPARILRDLLPNRSAESTADRPRRGPPAMRRRRYPSSPTFRPHEVAVTLRTPPGFTPPRR